MITDDLLQLMTAAIDGVLPPEEVRRLRRVLDSSAEARSVYARLKADSARLKGLPQVNPPADLHKRVMARVATVSPPRQPTSEPATVPFRTRVRPWVPAAIAAGLIVSVTSGSLWYFSRTDSTPQPLARKINQPPPATQNGATDPAWENWLPAADAKLPSAPAPFIRRPDEAFVRVRDLPPAYHPAEPDAVAIAPEPRPSRIPIFGAHLLPEVPPLDLVQVRVPFLKPVAEFAAEDVRQLLADELTRDPPHRIDLFARNTERGVEVFQKAATAAGLTLSLDATTLDRLKKRQVQSVVIYTEALTPAELASLFGSLAAQDAKISPRVFDMLHAAPVSTLDATDIRSILGIDPGLFKRLATEKTEKGTDPAKPLSAGTADQITKAVTTGSAKPGEKPAVLLSWGPLRTIPMVSAELKQYLQKRGERKPNAVPAIIVIRPGNG